MPTLEIIDIFIIPFNKLRIPYMVTGAVASIVYGEPRVTMDIDMVVELCKESVKDLLKLFPHDEYCLPPEDILYIEINRHQRGHFNIIHHRTGYRADIYLVGKDPFQRWGMENRKSINVGKHTVWVAPPEYVIVKKLQYFKEGGSQKHLRDIRSMLDFSKEEINMEQLTKFIEQYNLENEWREVIENEEWRMENGE